VDCAPATDLAVPLTLTTSGAAIANLPSTVTIPAGSTAGTFTVSTKAVTAKTVEKIQASAGAVVKTASLTVNP
jgi:hypothetical protein